MLRDKLVCRFFVVPIGPNEALEAVVQVHKVGFDGLLCCHVGYVPRRLFPRYQPKLFNGMVLRVVDDLRVSNNTHERARSYHFHGIVKCEVVNETRYCGESIINGLPCDVSFRESSDDDSSAKKGKAIASKRSARKRSIECTTPDDNKEEDDEDNIPLLEMVRRKKAKKRKTRIDQITKSLGTSKDEANTTDNEDNIPLSIFAKQKRRKRTNKKS
jgi:hypothetical protein